MHIPRSWTGVPEIFASGHTVRPTHHFTIACHAVLPWTPRTDRTCAAASHRHVKDAWNFVGGDMSMVTTMRNVRAVYLQRSMAAARSIRMSLSHCTCLTRWTHRGWAAQASQWPRPSPTTATPEPGSGPCRKLQQAGSPNRKTGPFRSTIGGYASAAHSKSHTLRYTRWGKSPIINQRVFATFNFARGKTLTIVNHLLYARIFTFRVGIQCGYPRGKFPRPPIIVETKRTHQETSNPRTLNATAAPPVGVRLRSRRLVG